LIEAKPEKKEDLKGAKIRPKSVQSVEEILSKSRIEKKVKALETKVQELQKSLMYMKVAIFALFFLAMANILYK